MKIADIRTETDLNAYIASCRRVRFRQKDTEGMSFLDIFKHYIQDRPETCYLRGSNQCARNRSRSMYDFAKLARHYKPDVTVKDLINVIFDYYFEPGADPNRQLMIQYCGTVRRYNFRMGYRWYSMSVPRGVVDTRSETERKADSIKASIVEMFYRDYSGIPKTQMTNLVANYYGAWLANRNRV